jgi:parallel beta-helix repeat protein
VRVVNSTDIVIKANAFRENSDGVDLQAGSHGNTVKDNEFSNNAARGIMLRSFSSENMIKENTFAGNRVGILVFGGTESTLKANLVTGSLLAGIRLNVIAHGNLILDNTVTSNPAGIEFLVTPTGSSIGNTLVENSIAMNGCGVKGPTDGNSFRENVFEGNGADSCP